MKNHHRTLPSRLLLPGLFLAAAAASAPAQEAVLTAETFGRASGDVPAPGLGLVLELLRNEGETPRLRLMGGLPGHRATLLVSGTRPATPAAGARGTELLVGSEARTLHGEFDARGRFELPLETLPEGVPHYVQGIHTGRFELADGPLLQASQGLVVERRALAPEAALAFDDLMPHLPEPRALETAGDLSELIQSALDSAGDSLRLAIEIEVTVGLGIEVVDAKAGGKAQLEVLLQRTAEGLYELEVAESVAALAGVGAGFGAEVAAEGAATIGCARIFEFHSAPGAARGVLGIALAMQFPALLPEREGELFLRASDRLAELQAAARFLSERSDELEAFVDAAVDARLARAEAALATASARVAAAERALDRASLRERPRRAVELAVRRAALATMRFGVRAAREARVRAESALAAVRAAHEAKRDELGRFFEVVARAGRIAAQVSQLRADAREHHVGWEARYAGALEGEAKIGIPIVDIKGLESSITGEMVVEHTLRRELARHGRPARTTLTSAFALESEIVGAVGAGFELKRSRTVEVAQHFVESPAGIEHTGASVTYGVDVCMLGTQGAFVQRESGVGRAWSMTLGGNGELSPSELASAASPIELAERFGALEGSLELADRRQENVDFAFSIDITGNGGGIEIEAEWADQGRELARSTTVAAGVQRVLEGAAQGIDLASGAVVTLD